MRTTLQRRRTIVYIYALGNDERFRRRIFVTAAPADRSTPKKTPPPRLNHAFAGSFLARLEPVVEVAGDDPLVVDSGRIRRSQPYDRRSHDRRVEQVGAQLISRVVRNHPGGGRPAGQRRVAAGRGQRRPLSRSQLNARSVTLPRQSVVCAGDQASQSNIQPPSCCCSDSTASR